MAGNLPVPLGVSVRLPWQIAGSIEAWNVLHFRNTGAAVIDQAKAEAITALVKAAFTSSGHAASLSTTASLGNVFVRDLRDNTNPEFNGTTAAVAGTAAGHLLPRATSFVVTLNTAKRGRSFKGRVFLWGFTEDVNDAGGAITAAASTAAVSFINTIRTNMASSQQLEMCVLSRFTTIPGTSAPIERNPPILETVVTATAKDTRWDSQRRRAIPGV